MCYHIFKLTYIFELRKNLIDKADDAGLAKYGTTDHLKDRLIGYWLKKKSQETHKQIQEMMQPTPSAPTEPASTSSNPASASASTAAPMEAPAGAEGTSGGGSLDEPVIFGRSTVTLTPANVDDKTSFFTNIDEAPDIDTKEENHVHLFEQGVQGVVPVAALVKILQGFQEELQDQVAILFSSFLTYIAHTSPRSYGSVSIHIYIIFV